MHQLIVELAGGVGGAKLARGLALALPAGAFRVIVNIADDFELYGLRICPDLDTVMYTLAGIVDPINGWGVAADTTWTLDAIAGYGEDPWFKLGDRDFATHILRTARLRSGARLTSVTGELAAALGIGAVILPVTDDPVATMLETPDGPREFQDYFVARRQSDDVTGVRFAGADDAAPTPEVLAALAEASLIVIGPSNPIVSIGPLLAVPGVRQAVSSSAAPVIAVSPIIGGKALKGPADRMLATLGHEVSAVGIARMYQGLADALVIDETDAALAPAIAELGLRPMVTQTIMGGDEDRRRLAIEILEWSAAHLAPGLVPA